MEDKNFKIMTALNYGYDNPESREMITPDETILGVAMKSAIDIDAIEQICLYGSMSSDPNALAMSQEFLKEAREKNASLMAKGM